MAKLENRLDCNFPWVIIMYCNLVMNRVQLQVQMNTEYTLQTSTNGFYLCEGVTERVI